MDLRPPDSTGSEERPPELLTVTEAAERAGVSRHTISLRIMGVYPQTALIWTTIKACCKTELDGAIFALAMHESLVHEEFWDTIDPLLGTEPQQPKGRRPTWLATHGAQRLAIPTLLALIVAALIANSSTGALSSWGFVLHARVSPALASPEAGTSRPNLVLIVTDDLDARSIAAMPTVKSFLQDGGASFTRFFASTPLCCPARSSILRGQYAHNHGVLSNGGPVGGYATFHRLGNEDSTVATWLHDAGYHTALLGKYLNGYPSEGDSASVPPGWDEWDAFSEAAAAGGGYVDYTLNEHGMLVAYGPDPADYSTDVLSAKATDFVQRASAADQPFFLYLAPFAPHSPSVPAPRHAAAFADAQMPRSPAFNEADVTDKPDWVRGKPLLTDTQMAELDERYRDRLRTLLAVDDMVGALVQTLEETGDLEHTYIFFTSDNGFHLGEHRLPIGKGTPYEEVVRVPLLVRGPGVPAGTAIDDLALLSDLAPTLAELAEVSAPGFVDGRSLVPLLHGRPLSGWRQAVLLEFFGTIRGGEPGTPRATLATPGTAEEPEEDEGGMTLASPGAPPYRALRTADLLYVEYAGTIRELYDLRADPHELENVAARADPALLARLSARLAELRRCAAVTCRAAEDAPLDTTAGRVPLASPSAEQTRVDTIEVVLWDGRDREVGRATLVATPPGAVTVRVDIAGLTPGEHGIHVHEVGVCDPSGPPQFASAGLHHNPTNTTHGGPPPLPGHAGDLGNIVVDQTGFAQLHLTTDRLGLVELRDVDGSALVIHADRDDLMTHPAGRSGRRMICGVIAPPQSRSHATPEAGTPVPTSE